MKLTKSKLKQIIREEVQKINLNEGAPTEIELVAGINMLASQLSKLQPSLITDIEEFMNKLKAETDAIATLVDPTVVPPAQ
jgi:hypothetical protein